MLRFIRITLAAMTAITVTGLAACSSNDTAAGSTITISASIETSGLTSESDQKIIYGSVAAIDGDNIAIAVGSLADTSAASGSGSTGLLTLTGETLTLTVTDATEFSSEVLGTPPQNAASSKTVSLSDIATGSILKITYDTKTSEAVSIAILSGAGLTGAPGQPGSSTGSSSGPT